MRVPALPPLLGTLQDRAEYKWDRFSSAWLKEAKEAFHEKFSSCKSLVAAQKYAECFATEFLEQVRLAICMHSA